MCVFYCFYSRFKYLGLALFFFSGGFIQSASAQWSENIYGNEWINYENQYLRIQVERSGIQRLLVANLPDEWKKTDPARWQLWHRGKECAIIQANEKELIFYGQLNDGASDSLVHRPVTARLNPYQSLFSDQGVYFLTQSPSPKRAERTNATGQKGTPHPFHVKKDTILYTDQFSFATFGVANALNQSYYNDSNSWTSTTIGGAGALSASPLPKEFVIEHTFKDLVPSENLLPVVEILFNGLLDGAHHIQVEVQTRSGEYKGLASTSFTGFGGRKVSFTLSDEFIDEQQKMRIKIYSTSTDARDWYGVSYCTITYSQAVDMGEEKLKYFYFPPTETGTQQLLTITNIPSSNIQVFNISDRENVSVFEGKRSDNVLNLSVTRKDSAPLEIILQSTDSFHEISAAHVSRVNLQPFFTYNNGIVNNDASAPDGLAYDYIIISSGVLKESAIEYGWYRSSDLGGGHRVFAIEIRDIYDQFNYGEPSPVAIRSFMRYMLRQGIRPKEHFLLLLGMSITYPSFLQKELPDEVPSFGDPGSDNLLIAGIQGTNPDLQAIPVGRIKAYSNTEVLNYLEKVKSYENESRSIEWRKSVIHLSGGHSASEIALLKSTLENLTPIVKDSYYGGDVTPVVKSLTTTERVNISEEVNRGVGMISYFGHGSQNVTDFDFGFATDLSRGYSNLNKYPLMYFNGCGVGNIFTSRSTHVLSDDWLLAKDKGAIAVIANSDLSYVTSSAKHIRAVYMSLFESEEIKTIGEALRDANESILSNNANTYDIANMHQAVLQGDPALKLIRNSLPDYLVNYEEGLKVFGKKSSLTISESDSVQLAIEVKNGGDVFNDLVDIEVSFEYRDGSKKSIRVSESAIVYKQIVWVKFQKDEQIARILVRIDPDNSLEEFTKANNSAELITDWNTIEPNDLFYPVIPVSDLIRPSVNITFDGRVVTDKAKVNSKEKLKLELRDDRSLPVTNDESLVEVFIKPCWDESCSFVQISASNITIAHQSDDERTILFEIDQGNLLLSGEYTLLVNATDRGGNTLPEPYTIRFTSNSSDPIESVRGSLLVYPNPATNYIKFVLDGHLSLSDVTSVTYVIYNSEGRVVKHDVFRDSRLSREWYWMPSMSNNSGIYIYQVTVQGKDEEIQSFNGRILLQSR